MESMCQQNGGDDKWRRVADVVHGFTSVVGPPVSPPGTHFPLTPGNDKIRPKITTACATQNSFQAAGLAF